MHHPITGDEPANIATSAEGFIGITPGLTIRQTMAKDFMAAMLSNSTDNKQGYRPFGTYTYDELANEAVKATTALIKALNQPQT